MNHACAAVLALALAVGANAPSGHVAHRQGLPGTSSTEYPFGQLSVSSNGALYYVDSEYGQVDELTPSGAHVVLRSLEATSALKRSVPGLSGLSLANNAMWFTAADGLYEASLTGRDVRRVGEVPGAVDLDVLADGATYFTTTTAIFERAPDGHTTHVAGGATIGFAEQQAGPQPATEVAINPDGVAGVSPDEFYFTNENRLYLVEQGVATMFGPQFSFFNGELAISPKGVIYGLCNWHMCRISGRDVTQLFKLPEPVKGVFGAPDALAISPSGTFYISYSDQSLPGKAGIVELSPRGKIVAVVASRST